MDLNLSNSHSCYWKKRNHSSVKKHRNTSVNIHNEGSAITQRVGKEQLQSWIRFAPPWGKMSACVYSATSVPASLFIPSTEEWGEERGGWRALEAEVLAPATESDGSPRNPLQVIQSDDSSPERWSMMSSEGWKWNGWMQLIWWEEGGRGKKKKKKKEAPK